MPFYVLPMMPTSQTPLLSLRNCQPLLLFLVAALATTVVSAPRIDIDDPSASFGERKTGEVVDHTFSIRNAGDRTLTLSGIRASCGCTVPKVTSLRIAPGEAETLPVRVDLTGRKGPQNQVVTFSTNDPDRPTVSLKLSGVAVPEISVKPRTLNLGQIDPASPPKGRIVLRSTSGKPFTVTAVEAAKGRVEVNLVPSPDRQSAEINVVPGAGRGDGQFTDVVVIRTDHPEVKQERVLVMWQINTGVTVAPSTVNLVLADRPQLLNRYLMVKGYPGLKEPLKVQNVTWPGQEQVDIKVTDTELFGWRIHLKNFEPVAGMDGSSLQIRTNAEGFETLQVPVKVLR